MAAWNKRVVDPEGQLKHQISVFCLFNFFVWTTLKRPSPFCCTVVIDSGKIHPQVCFISDHYADWLVSRLILTYDRKMSKAYRRKIYWISIKNHLKNRPAIIFIPSFFSERDNGHKFPTMCECCFQKDKLAQSKIYHCVQLGLGSLCDIHTSLNILHPASFKNTLPLPHNVYHFSSPLSL